MGATGEMVVGVALGQATEVSPTHKPRWSGNVFGALPIAPPYTIPAPIPPTPYQKYRVLIVSARPDPTQPSPTRTAPTPSMNLGPIRSTKYPSNGTSQVSSATNKVKVH